MTIKEITKRLQEIEDIKKDDEVAHSKQDQLTEAVLRTIAEGASNAKELAEETLKVYEIEFERWCA